METLGDLLQSDSFLQQQILAHLDNWSLAQLRVCSKALYAQELGRTVCHADGRCWRGEWRDLRELKDMAFSKAVRGLAIRAIGKEPRVEVYLGPCHFSYELAAGAPICHLPLFASPLHKEEIRYEHLSIIPSQCQVKFELLTPVNFCCKPSLRWSHQTTNSIHLGCDITLARGQLLQQWYTCLKLSYSKFPGINLVL